MNRKDIALFAAAVVLLALPFVWQARKTGSIAGTDDQAVEAIQRLRPGYHRWFRPFWEPPTETAENQLFALQATFGLTCMAVCILRGRSRASSRKRADADD